MNRSNGFLAIKNPIEFGEDRADKSFSTGGRGYFLRASVTGGIFRDLKTVLLYPANWLKIWSQLKYDTSIRMIDYGSISKYLFDTNNMIFDIPWTGRFKHIAPDDIQIFFLGNEVLPWVRLMQLIISFLIQSMLFTIHVHLMSSIFHIFFEGSSLFDWLESK